jgi:hypothetical protein
MFAGYLVYMLVMAAILALWEIQIEGKDGWAANLPTRRIEKGWLVKLTGGRPLTGYHLFLALFWIGLIHFPLFFNPWSWRLEFLIVGFGTGMGLAEDFLWFVFNPAYGIKKFRKGQIWWHKTWWGPVPSLYWILLAVTIVLMWFGKPAI